MPQEAGWPARASEVGGAREVGGTRKALPGPAHGPLPLPIRCREARFGDVTEAAVRKW